MKQYMLSVNRFLHFMCQIVRDQPHYFHSDTKKGESRYILSLYPLRDICITSCFFYNNFCFLINFNFCIVAFHR
jgi:hypothetical protein